jgi:hypothetical protein
MDEQLRAWNPAESARGIETLGICPYCQCWMSPDRWSLRANGYECLKCGHKQFLIGGDPRHCPCQCANCRNGGAG